jgi:chemotaxis protein histidine kinase CheA
VKRLPAAVLTALLTLTATAACGSDDDPEAASAAATEAATKAATDAATTAATEAPEEDAPAAGAGSDDVKAYCDKIEALANDAEAVVESKDMDKITEFSNRASELGQDAMKLTGVTGEDAQVLTECSQKAAKVMTDLAGSITP